MSKINRIPEDNLYKKKDTEDVKNNSNNNKTLDIIDKEDVFISVPIINIDENYKDSLKIIIQKWVTTDNEMRILNIELLKKKKLNKEYTEQLLFLIKKLEIETVDINNGYISYVKRNKKQPITKKILNDVFTKYYKGNVEEVERINNFITDNREIITKEFIIRKII